MCLNQRDTCTEMRRVGINCLSWKTNLFQINLKVLPLRLHPLSSHSPWCLLHYWLVCIRTSHEYRANRVACRKLSLIIFRLPAPPQQHVQANIWLGISFTLKGDQKTLAEMGRSPFLNLELYLSSRIVFAAVKDPVCALVALFYLFLFLFTLLKTVLIEIHTGLPTSQRHFQAMWLLSSVGCNMYIQCIYII